MQIQGLTPVSAGTGANDYPGGVMAAAAVLNDRSGRYALNQQLDAYRALADRWRTARPGERDVLAQALTESPFARGVQSTLNAFTRAAWAGSDAVPPEPQAKALQAFDSLSESDRQIVAAMQADRAGGPGFATPARYRSRLQAELDSATAAAQPSPRRADSVTLSEAAQAALDGGAPAGPTAQETQAPHPAIAAAIAAYTRVS